MLAAKRPAAAMPEEEPRGGGADGTKRARLEQLARKKQELEELRRAVARKEAERRRAAAPATASAVAAGVAATGSTGCGGALAAGQNSSSSPAVPALLTEEDLVGHLQRMKEVAAAAIAASGAAEMAAAGGDGGDRFFDGAAGIAEADVKQQLCPLELARLDGRCDDVDCPYRHIAAIREGGGDAQRLSVPPGPTSAWVEVLAAPWLARCLPADVRSALATSVTPSHEFSDRSWPLDQRQLFSDAVAQSLVGSSGLNKPELPPPNKAVTAGGCSNSSRSQV